MNRPAAFKILVRSATLASFVFSAGCVPYTRSYERLSFPNREVEYKKEDCNNSIGAPVWLGFDYHGVRIFASLDDSQAELLGAFNILWVEVPEGIEFSLDEYSVTLTFFAQDRYFETVLPLIGSMVLGAKAWRTSPSVDYEPVTAIFEGKTKKSVSFWGSEVESHDSVYFGAKEIPRIGDRGKMILPAVVINGVRYPGPTLVFQRDRYIGTSSLNC